MLLKRLIVGGVAFVALMYAAGCSQTTSNSVRDDKPAVTSTNRGSNKTIDDQIIPVPIGQNGNSNGNNGNGPDPLYTLVEETINLYNTKGDAISAQKNPNDYISLMGGSLEKLASTDLSGFNFEQRKLLGEAFSDYALSLKHTRNTSKALRMYEKAILLNPQEPAIRFNYGRMLCDEKRYADATREFEVVVKVLPDNMDAKKWLDYARKKMN